MSREIVQFNIDSNSIGNKKIAIIKAKFNNSITQKMLDISENILKQYNAKYKIFEVAGSFEVPLKIKQISNEYDGFIALGCLIKGETMHFEYVAEAVSNGIMNVSLELTKPVGFAILTCHNNDQALERIDNAKHATMSVLELLS